jgi:hypothetical protein
MKCHEVQPWLLGSRSATPLPSTVRQHLERCAACRQERKLLAHLDEQVRSLPLPAGDPAAKARLWERIAATEPVPVSAAAPPQPDSAPPVRLRVRWWRQLVAAAIAAGVLFALGWLAGSASRTGAMLRDEHDRTPLAAREHHSRTRKENSLILQVMRHDTHLASVTAAEEKLAVLHQLADDLKDAVVREVRLGFAEIVPAAAAAYQRVLRDGIVRWAAGLPEAIKRDQLSATLQRLRASQAELEKAAQTALPVVADMLRPMAVAASDSARRLEEGRPFEQAPDSAAGGARPTSLLVDLVQRGLQLAAEGDPLRRAEMCSAMARQLAPTMVLISTLDDAALAEEAGTCMGDLLEWGVARNLESAARADEKKARSQDLDTVRQESVQAVAVLENNLAQAPPATKEALQQAVEAAAPARERLVQPLGAKVENGRPPPWLRTDQPKTSKGKRQIPPGWLKKKL